MHVDNSANMWIKDIFPEKARKSAVDKPGDIPCASVDNLGISRGQPCKQFCNNCCGNIKAVRPIAAELCIRRRGPA